MHASVIFDLPLFFSPPAPINVAQVNVTGQEETNVTLQWNKVNGNGITYELQFSDRTNITIPVSDVDGSVTYTVSPLNAGTKYEFLLYTVFKGVPSKGYNFSAITRESLENWILCHLLHP
jgi:hypothetical protein